MEYQIGIADGQFPSGKALRNGSQTPTWDLYQGEVFVSRADLADRLAEHAFDTCSGADEFDNCFYIEGVLIEGGVPGLVRASITPRECIDTAVLRQVLGRLDCDELDDSELIEMVMAAGDEGAEDALFQSITVEMIAAEMEVIDQEGFRFRPAAATPAGKARQLLALQGECLFVDIEATDLGGEIVEIGVVDACGKELLNTLVRPESVMSDRARELTGITDEQLAGAPSFSAVSASLEEVLRGKTVVFYGAASDLAFLQRAGFDAACFTAVCAGELAAQAWGEWSWGLEALKIPSLEQALDRSGHAVGGAHRACRDAEAARLVVEAISRRTVADPWPMMPGELDWGAYQARQEAWQARQQNEREMDRECCEE